MPSNFHTEKSTKLRHYVLVDGQSFAIEIRRCEGQGLWKLKIINNSGESFVSDEIYASREAAYDSALAAFKEAGANGFN